MSKQRHGEVHSNSAYHDAFVRDVGICGYHSDMLVELSRRLYFAAGWDKNIKLTTKDDLEMC